MKKYETQVIIVSNQAVPNTTPVLDESVRPEKIILCASDRMLERETPVLENFFQSKNIRTEIYHLGDAYEFQELQERFLNLAILLEPKRADIGLNLTGGNKLMTMAAQQTFMQNGFDCFYVNIETDQIISINNQPQPPFNIADQLSIPDFFAIHGYQVTGMESRKAISAESREVCTALLENYGLYNRAIGEFNYLAARSEHEGSLKVRHRINENTESILSLFHKNRFISYYDDQQVEYFNEASRRFCQGFWLEDYAYLALTQLHKDVGLQDFACSIEIRSSGGTPNEIDAAFLHNNRLYIIECKTANMDHKGTDVLYKIDTIRRLAGLRTYPILITYDPLERFDKIRAKDLQLTVFEGTGIKNLKDKLQRILRK